MATTTTRRPTPAQARKAAVESDYTALYAAAGLTDLVAESIKNIVVTTQERATKRFTELQTKRTEQAKQTHRAAEDPAGAAQGSAGDHQGAARRAGEAAQGAAGRGRHHLRRPRRPGQEGRRRLADRGPQDHGRRQGRCRGEAGRGPRGRRRGRRPGVRGSPGGRHQGPPVRVRQDRDRDRDPEERRQGLRCPPGQRRQGVGHPRGGQRQAFRRRSEGCRDPQGERRQEGCREGRRLTGLCSLRSHADRARPRRCRRSSRNGEACFAHRSSIRRRAIRCR